MPDWQVRQDQGAFLGNMGTEIKAAIAEFSGFVDPMVAIRLQTADLTKSLEAYAVAANLSTEETERMKLAIAEGAKYQEKMAGFGLLEKLYGYVGEESKWGQEAAKLAKEKALLELDIIEAQLKALNIWEANKGRIADARKRVNDGNLGPDYKPTIVTYKDWWAGAEEAAKTQQEAANAFREAVNQWAEATKRLTEARDSLLYDNELSGLSARDQAEAARKRAEEAVAAARGGDVEARGAAGNFITEYLREFIDAYGRGDAYFAEEARLRSIIESLIQQPYTQGNAVAGPWTYPAQTGETSPLAAANAGSTPSPGSSSSGTSSSAADQQSMSRLVNAVEQLAGQVTILTSALRSDAAARQQRDSRQGQQTDVLLGRLGGLVDVLQRRIA
jgi:hypothetical protein